MLNAGPTATGIGKRRNTAGRAMASAAGVRATRGNLLGQRQATSARRHRRGLSGHRGSRKQRQDGCETNRRSDQTSPPRARAVSSVKTDELPYGFARVQLVETLVNLIQRDAFAHELVNR